MAQTNPPDKVCGRKIFQISFLVDFVAHESKLSVAGPSYTPADSVLSVFTWVRFHAKSKLRDKTPRGKQLVQALTVVGILLWQRNWRECRGREAARTGRHPTYRILLSRQTQHTFCGQGAGRQRRLVNQGRIGFSTHRTALSLRFAQNFESPSNGKSGRKNL